jgi:iron uptake system component EfeO
MSTLLRRAVGTVLSTSAALALAGCSGDGKDSSTAEDTPVIRLTVDIDSCGSSWSAPEGGRLTFALTNTFYNPEDVYLTDAGNGEYLAEYEGIGTGATLAQTVTLGNGSYRFVCFPSDAPDVTGPTVVVDRAAEGEALTPEVPPVSNADLIEPSLAYKRWIASRLPVLRRQVARLAADVRSGATARARADWLTAHETYETLGAAYDAFSSGDTDFDGEINGTPAAGSDPATDPDLTGFHKLEALLWSDAPAAELTPVADALRSSVGHLVRTFPTLNISPNDLPLRAHEIIENTVEFELNGYNDAGSHTTLATMSANLTGAEHALAPLVPVLRSRYPGLGETQQLLASTRTLLASYRHGGHWRPLEALTESQRAELNGAFHRTVEFLAPIPAICDMRGVVQQ